MVGVPGVREGDDLLGRIGGGIDGLAHGDGYDAVLFAVHDEQRRRYFR